MSFELERIFNFKIELSIESFSLIQLGASFFMRKDDARQLDHKTLEELRIRSVKRVQAGESPEAISKALGLNRSTIYIWLALYRKGGWDALKSKPTPGARPKIDGKKMEWLFNTVTQNPQQI